MSSLKEQNGRYYQEAEVVMLPTNEKSSIINLDNEELFHIDQYVPKLNKGNTHLYIISDEEIKEGDWFINNYKEEVFQCVDETHAETLKATSKYGWKKIIATTDESLKIDNDITNQTSAIWNKTDVKRVIIGSKSLPKPSDSFIKKYIEEYNKGEQITNILVEYLSCECQFQHEPELCERLKVDSNNTITIKKVCEQEPYAVSIKNNPQAMSDYFGDKNQNTMR